MSDAPLKKPLGCRRRAMCSDDGPVDLAVLVLPVVQAFGNAGMSRPSMLGPGRSSLDLGNLIGHVGAEKVPT